MMPDVVHAGPFLEAMRYARLPEAGGETARVVAKDLARPDLDEHGRKPCERPEQRRGERIVVALVGHVQAPGGLHHAERQAGIIGSRIGEARS